MRAVVTGAAGFIGGHVVEALAGCAVVAFDLRAGGDVRDADALDRVLPGADVVIHQAAKVGLGLGVRDMPDYVAHNMCGHR